MKDKSFSGGLRTKMPSELIFDVAGKGYTRFLAEAGLEAASLANDISPKVRFFVFDAQPDMDQLVRTSPETPVAPPPGSFTVDSLTGRVYRHALARDPTPKEQLLASGLLAKSGKITDEGLADLIWCVVMLPEFQLVR